MRTVLLFSTTLLAATLWNNGDYFDHNTKSFFARADVNCLMPLDSLDMKLLEAAVFYATNEAREEHDKSIFIFGPKLQIAARAHSAEMQQNAFLDHINRKDRRKRTPSDRVEIAGGNYRGVGENLALVNVFKLGPGQRFFIGKDGKAMDRNGKPLRTKTYAELARDVVEDWMNSPGHRQNILDNYTDLGCGVSSIHLDKKGIAQIYITQNFGRN